MRRRIPGWLVTTVAAAIGCWMWSSQGRELSARSPSLVGPGHVGQQGPTQADAYREAHGIPATVQMFGNYQGREVGQDPESVPTLAALAAKSALVFIGRPRQNRCWLSSDERHILTEYEVVGEEVLKGPLVVGQSLKVSLPGGMVPVAGGMRAETVTPDFRKMMNGKRYVLFVSANDGPDLALTRDPSDRGYLLTARGQGLFEVPENGRVTSHGAYGATLTSWNGKDVDLFLEELRRSLRVDR